jgi:hypothetical protein
MGRWGQRLILPNQEVRRQPGAAWGSSRGPDTADPSLLVVRTASTRHFWSQKVTGRRDFGSKN